MKAILMKHSQKSLSKIPGPLLRLFRWLESPARRNPTSIFGGPGSGKSFMAGRIIAWYDLLSQTPLVIVDPHGGTISYFLDKISRLEPELQEHYLSKIDYIDVSGKLDYTTSLPFLYRLGNETMYEISQRFVDVVRLLYPGLEKAPMLGMAALEEAATNAGMLLAAMDMQLTEAVSLLRNPAAYDDRIRAAQNKYPEQLAEPIEWLKRLKKSERAEFAYQTSTFFRKLSLFKDPAMKAFFGAKELGIDWHRWHKEGRAILFDFKRVTDEDLRRFLLLWVYHCVKTFIRFRGPGHQNRGVSLIMDELSEWVALDSLTSDAFAKELNNLINVIARQYGVMLTVLSQELFQFSPMLQKTLLAMGNQFFGRTGDFETAMALAQHFSRHDPYFIKKTIPVYMSGFMGSIQIVDHQTEEFTIDEQLLEYCYKFLDLGRFEFMMRLGSAEGDTRGIFQKLSIASFDKGLYPDMDSMMELQRSLVKQGGRPIEKINAEIKARRAYGKQSLSLEKHQGVDSEGIDLDSLGNIPAYGPASDK